MKPVCVPCERFMRPAHNGYYFLEGMPLTNGAPSGKADPSLWKPYKLWTGDMWACPDCGAQIVVGIATGPVTEHFMPGFKGAVERFAAMNRGKPLILVKDC